MWHIKITCNKIKCDFREFSGNLIVHSDNLDICQKNDDTGAKLNIYHVLTATKLITAYFRRAYIILSLLSSYVVGLIIMVVNNLLCYFMKFISAFIPLISFCFLPLPFIEIYTMPRTCALVSSFRFAFTTCLTSLSLMYEHASAINTISLYDVSNYFTGFNLLGY